MWPSGKFTTSKISQIYQKACTKWVLWYRDDLCTLKKSLHTCLASAINPATACGAKTKYTWISNTLSYRTQPVHTQSECKLLTRYYSKMDSRLEVQISCQSQYLCKSILHVEFAFDIL